MFIAGLGTIVVVISFLSGISLTDTATTYGKMPKSQKQIENFYDTVYSTTYDELRDVLFAAIKDDGSIHFAEIPSDVSLIIKVDKSNNRILMEFTKEREQDQSLVVAKARGIVSLDGTIVWREVLNKLSREEYVEKTMVRSNNAKIQRFIILYTLCGIAVITLFVILYHYSDKRKQQDYNKHRDSSVTLDYAFIGIEQLFFFTLPDGTKFVNETFDKAGSFAFDRAPVEKDGRWNFLTRDGKYLCSYWFEDVEPFRNGYTYVKTHGKWHEIDMDGNFKNHRAKA